MCWGRAEETGYAGNLRRKKMPPSEGNQFLPGVLGCKGSPTLGDNSPWGSDTECAKTTVPVLLLFLRIEVGGRKKGRNGWELIMFMGSRGWLGPLRLCERENPRKGTVKSLALSVLNQDLANYCWQACECDNPLSLLLPSTHTPALPPPYTVVFYSIHHQAPPSRALSCASATLNPEVSIRTPVARNSSLLSLNTWSLLSPEHTHH